jgi:hypothetical protein
MKKLRRNEKITRIHSSQCICETTRYLINSIFNFTRYKWKVHNLLKSLQYLHVRIVRPVKSKLRRNQD